MDISVELQEPFSYALWPIVVTGLLIACCLLCLIVCRIMAVMKGRRSKNKIVVKLADVKDIMAIKSKYLERLNQIQSDVASGSITTRTAYQKMSICIREFVYEVTGISVQNCTLQDIKQLRMPVLEELITEYYHPEFAIESVGDSMASIEKTKRAIERWN